MLIPDALAVVLATGTVTASVTAPWLVKARRRTAQVEKARTEEANSYTRNLNQARTSYDQRLQEVVGEMRHLVQVRLPGLVAHLAAPHVPVPPLAQEMLRGTELDELHRAVLELLAKAVHEERIRVDAAAQAVIRWTAQSARAHSIRMQGLLVAMQDAFDDPKVLEYVLTLDRLNEFTRRRWQAAGIVCGDTPGLTRENTHLEDLVMAAASRIEGFEQIETVNFLDPDRRIGVVAPAAEPVAIVLAELLANAVYYSTGTIRPRVEIHETPTGASVIIDDAGTGMNADDVEFVEHMLSSRRVLLTDLREPVRLGLAAVGRLIHDFPVRVTLSVSPYGGVRAVLDISSDLLVPMDPNARPVSVMAPIPLRHGRRPEVTPEAVAGQAPGHQTPVGPAGLPQRRRQQPVSHAAPAGDDAPAPRDAEQIRARYAGLQNGTDRGRTEVAPTATTEGKTTR